MQKAAGRTGMVRERWVFRDLCDLICTSSAADNPSVRDRSARHTHSSFALSCSGVQPLAKERQKHHDGKLAESHTLTLGQLKDTGSFVAWSLVNSSLCAERKSVLKWIQPPQLLNILNRKCLCLMRSSEVFCDIPAALKQ